MAFAIPAAVVSLLLPIAIGWLSDAARGALVTGLRGFYQAALDSPKGWDDIAAKIICTIFSVPTADIKPSSGAAVNIPSDLVDPIVDGILTVATGSGFNPPGNQLGGA